MLYAQINNVTPEFSNSLDWDLEVVYFNSVCRMLDQMGLCITWRPVNSYVGGWIIINNNRRIMSAMDIRVLHSLVAEKLHYFKLTMN